MLELTSPCHQSEREKQDLSATESSRDCGRGDAKRRRHTTDGILNPRISSTSDDGTCALSVSLTTVLPLRVHY